MHDHTDDHDLGPSHDLRRLLGRRDALAAIGGLGAAALLGGCGSSADRASPTTTSTPTTPDDGSDSCATIPEETAGPFPGDGSNGPNVLSESGAVRGDIRSSFGSASGTAAGVPLTIRFTVLSVAGGCQPLDGAAVYVWHCDREGRYSLYSSGVTGENYLRGVQAAGGDGVVSFTSIFPGCYAGRWPHVHFEVYPSLDAATNAGNQLATSQIALPEDACRAVYGTTGYEQSVTNLARVSLERDNVFADGWSRELGTVTGSAGKDLAVALTVPV